MLPIFPPPPPPSPGIVLCRYSTMMMNGLTSGTPGDVVPDQRSMSTYFSQIDTLTSHPENEVEFFKGKEAAKHACMHACTHARTHARTHTHTHTHTCTCGKSMFFLVCFLIIQTDSLNKILHRNNACYKKKNLIIQTDLLNKILDRNIACYCHNFLQENKITHLRKMKNTHHTSKY